MAKNKKRNNPASQQNAAKISEKNSSGEKKRESLYQIKTRRTSGIIKAYITFTYRVMHPKVTPRLLLYGILVAAPGIFFFKDPFWKVFFIAVGAVMILLAFFRQYISLLITRRNDPDYKNGTEFTYDFYDLSATVSKNDVLVSRMTNYKSITAFYYDDDYYYLALEREVHVLPKTAFTVGEPAAFEEFIYKKSRKTCHWLPYKLSDRIRQKRAARTVSAENMSRK